MRVNTFRLSFESIEEAFTIWLSAKVNLIQRKIIKDLKIDLQIELKAKKVDLKQLSDLKLYLRVKIRLINDNIDRKKT